MCYLKEESGFFLKRIHDSVNSFEKRLHNTRVCSVSHFKRNDMLIKYKHYQNTKKSILQHFQFYQYGMFQWVYLLCYKDK